MTEPVMKYGARKGSMNTLRRWIVKASTRDIRVFPVPGADILRMYQSELESDFIIAPNPREANVLLVVGELTDALAQKAAVTYQQLPRPRVLVVAGSEELPYLPEPNAHVSLDEGFLNEILPQVRQLLQDYAWSEHAEPWQPDFLTEMVEDSENGGGHNHHHGHDHNHDHDAERDDENDDQEGHKHNNHSDHELDQHKNHCNDHGSSDEDDHGHAHEDHDHSGHDHGDMDFMSMVAMTKVLPRPKDGLPMNQSEVHFGPFHPGLPGGLSVFMELDGDTVIEARVEGDVATRSFEEFLPVDAKELPNVLARLNPLTHETYRLLAQKALEHARSDEQQTSFTWDDLLLLEKERIDSHLNWLTTFAKTLGNEWMHRQACRWHRIIRKERADFGGLRSFLDQIRSMPYLRQKLSVGRGIPDELLHHLSGPVAKAAGINRDLRARQKQYQNLGWEPVIKQGNSAWGRLLVRLDEVEQSLELINKADHQQENNRIYFSGSGEGAAQIESPRGTVSLNISIQDGIVQELLIETPSQPLAGLVPTLAGEAELSDALVQVASLDISPWEVGLKSSEVQ